MGMYSDREDPIQKVQKITIVPDWDNIWMYYPSECHVFAKEYPKTINDMLFSFWPMDIAYINWLHAGQASLTPYNTVWVLQGDRGLRGESYKTAGLAFLLRQPDEVRAHILHYHYFSLFQLDEMELVNTLRGINGAALSACYLSWLRRRLNS